MIPITLGLVHSWQAFHFQEHAGEPEPRGRGGRVSGPSHRRPQHRQAALGARQEVPAHLQGARPGEEGQGVDTRALTRAHISSARVASVVFAVTGNLGSAKSLCTIFSSTTLPLPSSPEEVAQSQSPALASFNGGGSREGRGEEGKMPSGDVAFLLELTTP